MSAAFAEVSILGASSLQPRHYGTRPARKPASPAYRAGDLADRRCITSIPAKPIPTQTHCRAGILVIIPTRYQADLGKIPLPNPAA